MEECEDPKESGEKKLEKKEEVVVISLMAIGFFGGGLLGYLVGGFFNGALIGILIGSLLIGPTASIITLLLGLKRPERV